MSEIIRLLIMIGEMVGFLIFSIYVLYKHHERCMKNSEMQNMKRYIRYAIEGNIFNILVFALSYPGFRFLSYNKLITFSIVITLLFITKLMIFIFTNYSKNNVCMGVCIVSVPLFLTFFVCLILGSFEVPNVCLNFVETIDKHEEITELYFTDNISFEKHTVYTTFLDHDRRESDERYLVTTEDVFYILHEEGKTDQKFNKIY